MVVDSCVRSYGCQEGKLLQLVISKHLPMNSKYIHNDEIDCRYDLLLGKEGHYIALSLGSCLLGLWR